MIFRFMGYGGLCDLVTPAIIGSVLGVMVTSTRARTEEGKEGEAIDRGGAASKGPRSSARRRRERPPCGCLEVVEGRGWYEAEAAERR